ncbi:MAG: hypothetical protein LBC20_10575 [Planctomycetaceae bacterium]|jgi:hypothetical protein|nr:hypothetical protein [Planctomycetaceae bacterium]
MSTDSVNYPFVQRRGMNPSSNSGGAGPPPGVERRQFSNCYDGLSPDAQQLAEAIDQYKFQNRRRFITYEEMLSVIKSLGYHK